jgi:hypothetical protein
MPNNLLAQRQAQLSAKKTFIRGEDARMSSGMPGYSNNAVYKAGASAWRAGNPPNFGQGIHVAAKPMSAKKKSTLHGPACGFLAPGIFDRKGEKKIDKDGEKVYKIGDAKLMNLKLPLRKIMHDTFSGQGGKPMYDTGSFRIKEEGGEMFFYFKTSDAVLEDIKSEDKLISGAENIEYRINLSEAFAPDYTASSAGSTDSLFRELFDVTTTAHDALSNRQADLLQMILSDNDTMNSCYEVEFSHDGGDFENLQVYGLPVGDDGALAPITGDLDAFALLMPMEELMTCDLGQLECGVIKEDATQGALKELDNEIQQLKDAAPSLDVSEMDAQLRKIEELTTVKTLFKAHVEKHLTNTKTGFATGYEFSKLSKIVMESYKELCLEIKPGEDGIIDFTDDKINTFYETCAAIFQHGPETNNPNPGTLDADIYWCVNGQDVLTRSEDEHIQFLTTPTGPGEPAPCENLIIKINPKWNMEKWKPVYDMMKESFEKKYEGPTMKAEGSFSSREGSALEAKNAHTERFEAIMGPDVVRQQNDLTIGVDQEKTSTVLAQNKKVNRKVCGLLKQLDQRYKDGSKVSKNKHNAIEKYIHSHQNGQSYKEGLDQLKDALQEKNTSFTYKVSKLLKLGKTGIENIENELKSSDLDQSIKDDFTSNQKRRP